MSIYRHETRVLSSIILQTIDILIYSSAYLSIAGFMMGIISCLLQGIKINPIIGIIMFLITFSVYNINRKTDEKEDFINHIKRFEFTKKFGQFLFLISIVAYLFALIIAGTYGIINLIITLIPLIFGSLYSVPILSSDYKYRRLKEIPVIKNVIVGIAWAIPPAFLPTYIASRSPTSLTLIICLFFYSLAFINSTLFDMRDVDGDRLAGVYTIPVIIGISKTILLLSIINGILGAIIIFTYYSKVIPFSHLVIIFFPFAMHKHIFFVLNISRRKNFSVTLS